MIHAVIDGIPVEVEKGTTILQAAESVGIKIPTLCYIKGLMPDGSCRMCMVEIENRGWSKLDTACSAHISEGDVIQTKSEKVIASRRGVLDLLLSNHKTDCFSCEGNGSCKLQDYCYEYGVEKTSYEGEMTEFPIDDSMIIKPLPLEEAKKVEIVRGPNIQPLPIPDAPENYLKAQISLKAVDNISTDDITPASAEFSSMRSNIPLMSQYCYHRYDPTFAARAKEMGKSFIIGGENYGQGSSREHAAINPMYLGVKAVIAKSIARIHRGNLINHGVIPMLFADPADYDKLEQEDELEINGLLDQMPGRMVEIRDVTKDFTFKVKLDLSDSELEVITAGGQLRHLQNQLKEMEQ